MAANKTVLVVLALASAAALAMSGGGDDEKLPDLPPPPDDDDDAPIGPDDPTVPIPTPFPDPPLPGVKDSVPLEQLSNVHQLRTADDFEAWGILDAVEPNGTPGPVRNVVVLGYDDGWIGRPAALDSIAALAAANPDVRFAIFDFATSKQLTGQPESPIGYFATAIGPDRRARAVGMLGRKKTLGPLGDSRWSELVRYARSGPTAQQEELRSFDNHDYHYVVLARPRNGQWEWKVWRDVFGEDGESLTGGRQATKALAFEAAQVYVMGLGTPVVAQGG